MKRIIENQIALGSVVGEYSKIKGILNTLFTEGKSIKGAKVFDIDGNIYKLKANKQLDKDNIESIDWELMTHKESGSSQKSEGFPQINWTRDPSFQHATTNLNSVFSYLPNNINISITEVLPIPNDGSWSQTDKSAVTSLVPHVRQLHDINIVKISATIPQGKINEWISIGAIYGNRNFGDSIKNIETTQGLFVLSDNSKISFGIGKPSGTADTSSSIEQKVGKNLYKIFSRTIEGRAYKTIELNVKALQAGTYEFYMLLPFIYQGFFNNPTWIPQKIFQQQQENNPVVVGSVLDKGNTKTVTYTYHKDYNYIPVVTVGPVILSDTDIDMGHISAEVIERNLTNCKIKFVNNGSGGVGSGTKTYATVIGEY